MMPTIQQQDPFIECRDVFKFYERAGMEVVALRGLDLEVQRGAFLAIIGASGSGKSTLAGVLAGRDGLEVTGGSATFKEQDLLELAPEARARELIQEAEGVDLVDDVDEAQYPTPLAASVRPISSNNSNDSTHS